jgi:hypothetical protein
MERCLLQFLYALDETSRQFGLWIKVGDNGTIGIYNKDGKQVAEDFHVESNDHDEPHEYCVQSLSEGEDR